MKLRNGFVSNSSSSSFILVYNKEDILEGPEAIVNYLRQEPHNPIIFYGRDLNEGDDIFEMDEEFETLIRRNADSFIQQNQDGVVYYDYSEESLDDNFKKRPLRAFKDAYLLMSESKIYKETSAEELGMNPEIAKLGDPHYFDPDKKCTVYYPWFLDLCKEKNINTDEEIGKLANECISTYYREKEALERKLWAKREEEYGREWAKERNKDTYEAVRVDYSPTEYAEDFTERYLTSESAEDYGGFLDHFPKRGVRPYMISYDFMFTTKTKILERIKTLHDHVSSDYFLFGRYNKAYGSLTENVNLELFNIGPKEYEYFVEHENDFLSNNREYVLFTNAEIFFEGKIPVGKSMYELSYGAIQIIKPNEDLRGFKKLI